MNKTLTLIGTILSGMASLIFSFGTLFCVIYGIYLWGGTGLEFGSAVWQALVFWFKLMLTGFVFAVAAMVMLAKVGKSVFYYFSRNKTHSRF